MLTEEEGEPHVAIAGGSALHLPSAQCPVVTVGYYTMMQSYP
jgi:hypothetical protein